MKSVLVDCHEPIAVDPDYMQSWGDVYLRFKTRPGQVHLYAPTLMSRLDVERELEFLKDTQAKYPKYDYSEDIAYNERVLNALKTQNIYLDTEGQEYKDRIPNIYTSKDKFNKAEAERMLQVFMTHLGFKKAKFVWKRPGIVFTPVG